MQPSRKLPISYMKPMINMPSISTTSIITVKLFVTTVQLARGQTSVIMVKIGACRVKIRTASENSGCGKNLILQFNPMCKQIHFIG